MPALPHLFENNRAWAAQITAERPDFFQRLAGQQAPEYLWIGCSDSRVPANQIVGLMPGELFVHRNVANLVVPGDLNCLSVIQYALDILKVQHIIVCGHYGCGGVRAALEDASFGLIDGWLRHVKDVRAKHADAMAAIEDPGERARRLCELNVIEQALNVCASSPVQDAWKRAQPLAVYGWIYDVRDGLLRDLQFTVRRAQDAVTVARAAAGAVT